MALGIGLWFTLPSQPGVSAYTLALLALIAGLALWQVRADHPRAMTLRLLGFAAIFMALGFGLCGLRAWRVEAGKRPLPPRQQSCRKPAGEASAWVVESLTVL